MANKYHQVAELLRNTAKDINVILVDTEDEMHRIRLVNELERSAGYILLITGAGDAKAAETPVLGPAKTVGGQPIKKMRTFTEKDLIPSDDKVFKLKQEVESAIEYFRADRTPESIIAQIPDLVIRGVAKKVGITVTKDKPEVLTPEFVGEVQAKVKEQFPGDGFGHDADDDHEFGDNETGNETANFGNKEAENGNKSAQTEINDIRMPAIPPVAGEGRGWDVVNEPAADLQKPTENENLADAVWQEPEATDTNVDAKKQAVIADLQHKADQEFEKIENLKANLATEPNKNKRTAIRRDIATAEANFASLSKQLEDANKD